MNVVSDPRPPAGAERPALVIVQRGYRDVYQALAADLGASGQAVVAWDRRVASRRRSPSGPPGVPERRAQDRRQAPPETWSLFGFVLVHPPP